ncbi:MAG: NACHT domain-containing protein, partial [Candidatus Promineifilaceae bacterium]
MIKLYGSMRVFGQTEPRPLDDIFTDVRILPKPTLWKRFSLESLHEDFLERDRDMPARYDERVAADKMIKTESKLFILGKPGAGKTTFCKHLAVREARGRGPVGKVPIFVTLKQYADTDKTLIDFIAEQFSVCDFPEAELFVEALLRDGKALVLFDGLDEVTKDADGRNRVAAEINQFSRKYSECHIVVTCRVAATDYSFGQFRYVEMAEFAPEQVETFVRQWFMTGEASVNKADKMLTELDQNEGIRDLTRNPLLLTLLCLNYDETMAFPSRRVEIYQDALDALLKKWDSSRGVQRGSAYGSLSLGRKQEMLAELAYETYCEGQYFFERREIAPRLAEYVAGAPEVPAKIDLDGEVILQEIVAQHGVLAYRATDIISFSHKTFHEYFTAKQIVDDREAGTFHVLLQHAAEDSWKEVFELTASLLRKRAASNFFKLFVKTLHVEVQKRPNVVEWLAQIDAAAVRSESNYLTASIRAFFAFDRARALDLGFAHVLSFDLAR